MFVLMDMEWNDETGSQEPTQIAALRLDQDMNEADVFFRRIRPAEGKSVNWKHVAFLGGEPELFLNADDRNTVFGELSRWFMKGDILLWWHEEAATQFTKQFSGFETVPVCSGVIHHAVRTSLTDEKSIKGSPYHLAVLRGITAPGPEHCSLNDVQAIRLLLTGCGILPESLIEKGCLVWTSMEHMKQPMNFGRFTVTGQISIPLYMRFPYVHDGITGFFHKSRCTLYNRNGVCLRGYSSIEACVRHKLHPCECCRAEVDRLLKDSEVSRGNVQDTAAPSLKDLFEKEKEKLDRVCSQNGLSFFLNDRTLFITSKYGSWRILMDKYTGKPVLYHRNRDKQHKSEPDKTVRNYHRQNTSSDTLTGYVRSIIRHDAYTERKPGTPGKQIGNSKSNRPPARKYRKDPLTDIMAENLKRKKETARVQSLLGELEPWDEEAAEREL